MARILLKNVTKTYPGNITAVKDFNLEIQDKQFVIFVGPSGCGKSTTLRMIAGLEEITGGELHIGDRLVNNVEPKDRDIAMVFQNYALYPHMSVYENMAFGLRQRKTPKAEIDKRVKEAAELLEITPYLNRKPRVLSGGQRQRVALGRAMVREPAVFLLDEPLSNLDAKLRTAMRLVISKLHKRLQTTFVYVTHDQVEAMTMGDIIVVMKDGVIQQVAPPQELYKNPCNEFVAGFIGSPQINFINTRISEKDNGYTIFIKDKSLPISSKPVFKDYIDKEVTLGVRPEGIKILPNESPSSIKATVELCEIMGADAYVYLLMNNQPITVKTSENNNFRTGDTVFLEFDNSKLHFFDKTTHNALE